MKIGISAIHVRPQRSGSHQPYMVNLVEALAGLDSPHQFTIFVTPANQYLFEAARGKMDFVVYPRIVEQVLPRIFFEQLRIPLEARLRRLDVMHYPGTTASFLIRPADVVTVHHDSVTQRGSMSRLHNFYYDALLPINKRAGVIIVPTRVYADQLTGHFAYRPEKLRAIHHGVNPNFRNVDRMDIQEARAKYGIPENCILTVANTLPHKNIPNLLRAYDILLTRYRLDTHLVLVGNVDRPLLAEHIAEVASNPQEMHSHIKVISFLPHEQLPPIYAAAMLFVFYSKVETFGMPLVEAMACGLPVVASDIPIHREIMYEGAEFASPDDPEVLASKLCRAITDEAHREIMKAASLERSLAFSWEQTARQTIQAYEEAWSARPK
ncbi:MAG: glycosyltransferase family 1 protein [Chloroflexota bacterium]